jgi:hypothetical protein
MRMPDFICVGAQKAGTTWFYEQISRHPQVFMRTKEIDFFFKPLDLSWIRKFSKKRQKLSCAATSHQIMQRSLDFLVEKSIFAPPHLLFTYFETLWIVHSAMLHLPYRDQPL